MNLIPSKSGLMTIAWTVGLVAVLNRTMMGRQLLRGNGG